MKKALWVTVFLLFWHWDAAAYHLLTRYRCLATAYAQWGITKLGTLTHRGIVAADPRVFPLGTRIRVTGAGPYSGTYVVTDTAGKVLGRHIDIYIPELRAARRFGRKTVLVSVLKWGDPDA